MLEFIEVKSKRGGSLLTWDGFEYQFERMRADDNNAPANGIRRKGLKRKSVYVRQDQHLQQIFAEFVQRANDPIGYLRTVSYHLAATWKQIAKIKYLAHLSFLKEIII